MLTSLQRTKLQNRFKLLDLDGDGYLEEQDFNLLVERINETFCKYNHTAGTEVREGYLGFWRYVVEHCDLDGDGRLSPEEFLNGVEHGILANEGNYDNSIGRALSALFESLDADSDRSITRQEFAPLTDVFGVRPEHVSVIFDKLDGDDDGQVSIEVMLAAAKELYFGDDPESAGGHVLGKEH